MNKPSYVEAIACPRLPTQARAKLAHLEGKRDLVRRKRKTASAELEKVTAYLGIADDVRQALDELSKQLFGRIVEILEEKLTLAIQEVLEQPIVLKVKRGYKHSAATIRFHAKRNGRSENIMKGQGGSVANILSVGLRMFALTTLDPKVHRRFLVLDEQDCWLRPDLVPRLVKIVHDAGSALGFQVLLISHHDVSAFEKYADKIYEFIPSGNEVQVQERAARPKSPDE